MSRALIITTVSGFLPKFENDNVKILRSLGFDVHYAANPEEQIYSFPEETFNDLGVTFHPVRIAKSPYRVVTNLKAISELIKIINREEAELIHCHTPVGGLIGRIAAQCVHLRSGRYIHVIYTAHGLHFYKGAPLKNHILYGTVERFLARFTDDIILINKEDYITAGKFRLKKDGKVHLIPGVGLDREEFRPYTKEERKRARDKLGLGERDLLILSVGELNKNKNHEIVIKALHKMHINDAKDRCIKYIIAGEGDLRDKLEDTIKQYGLENNITLFGYCPAKADWPNSVFVLQDLLGAADLFCFPSVREGLGMAPLEALAMGVPVLAADNRGSREYLQDGRNGYVCEWNDADSWVEGIEKIMAVSEEEKEKLSAYCRESTSAFDKRNTNLKMREIYDRARESINKKRIQR